MDRVATTGRPVRWPAVVSGVLCLAGLAVAAYLTYAHYTTAAVLACSDKGLVNCAKVTTSSYSRILGLPVSDLGVAYFMVMAVLCSPWAWRSQHRVLRGFRVLAALSGVGLVVWLIYAELFRLDAICLYCTAVHVITALLFVTVAFGTAVTGPAYEDEVEDHELEHAVPSPANPERVEFSN
jgi:uncharacterized membrane protein